MVLVASASLAGPADDPAGWSGAKWGMTSTEVRTAVPGCKPIRYEFEAGVFATLGADAVQLGDGPAWSVYFVFDSAGQLVRVAMQPAARTFATQQEFSRLESLIADKYGRPFDRNAGDSAANYPAVRRAAWSAGQTSITLVHTDYRPRVQLQTLWLTYRPRPSVPL